MKKRKRRNRERIYKIFLLLVSIVLAVGLRFRLSHEEPFFSAKGNEPSIIGSLTEESRENGVRFQELEKQKINLNRASLEDLMTLPGIGEKTARSILEYKGKNGPFRSIESVMEVKGVGPRKFERFKSFITIN